MFTLNENFSMKLLFYCSLVTWSSGLEWLLADCVVGLGSLVNLDYANWGCMCRWTTAQLADQKNGNAMAAFWGPQKGSLLLAKRMCNVSKSALGAGLDQCFSWDLVCNLEWPSWLGRTELIFGTSFRIRIRILLFGRTRSPIRSLISGVWNRNRNQNWDCFFNRLELKANCQFQSRLLGTRTEPNLSSKTRTRTQARSFLKNWTQKQISCFHLHVDPEAEVLSKEPPNMGLESRPTITWLSRLCETRAFYNPKFHLFCFQFRLAITYIGSFQLWHPGGLSFSNVLKQRERHQKLKKRVRRRFLTDFRSIFGIPQGFWLQCAFEGVLIWWAAKRWKMTMTWNHTIWRRLMEKLSGLIFCSS
jgi:hypothetical protein